MAGSGVLTILFTDLVASTEQTQRLGEEGADELRRTHFALLREAIGAHGGEEVKTVGDGLMVVFPSPSEAVACAVAMQQVVDHHNGCMPEPLGLRVGLHTGEVTPDVGDYFGTPVVVAERLCRPGRRRPDHRVPDLASPRGGPRRTDLQRSRPPRAQGDRRGRAGGRGRVETGRATRHSPSVGARVRSRHGLRRARGRARTPHDPRDAVHDGPASHRSGP